MVKDGKAEQEAARSARLAAALRENLKRRKAQSRGRAAGGTDDEEKPTTPGPHVADIPDFRRNRGSE